MVKELLQFFVRVVDAELFEAIGLKDLETGEIEYSDKVTVVAAYTASVKPVVDSW